MPEESSKIVTNHGEFYRSTKGDETRFYAVRNRETAIQFADGGDATIVMGFAVYDTTISSTYAVALYATLAEAEAHQPTPAPTAPEGVFNAEKPAAQPFGKKAPNAGPR
jgi:hypothetical protein